MNRLLAKFRALLRKDKLDRDMAEEMHFHLKQRIADKVADGMSPDEARYAAERKFGNIGVIQEAARDERGFVWLEQLFQDVRYAARSLRKNPGFTAVAALTLALGVGISAVVFSIVDAVIFQRVPFTDAGRLVAIEETDATGKPGGVSPANFLDWAKQSSVFEKIAAKIDWSGYNLPDGDEPEQVIGVPVSAEMFGTLGKRPVLGRTFLPDEDKPGAPPVVVLSHRLWQRRFQGASNTIGTTLNLNGQQHTIIGVMPPGFYLNRDGLSVAETDQLWVPLAQLLGARGKARRDAQNLRVWARLKPGVTIEHATMELRTIHSRLVAELPEKDRGRSVRLVPLRDWRADRVQPLYSVLGMMVAAVGFVLLIASSNVANLQLARATTRSREMAVRLALGAGRSRLVRQLLTESLLLTVLGTGIGLLFATWIVSFTPSLLPENLQLPRMDQLLVDGRVIGVTVGFALLSSIGCGLIPAFQSTRANLQDALKSGGRGSGEDAAAGRWRNMIVSGEVALALVLLTGAGLLTRTFLHLLDVNPGFQPTGVLTLKVPAPDRPVIPAPDEAQRRLNFVRTLLERVQNLPGVKSVALVDRLPLAVSPMYSDFNFPNEPAVARGRTVTHAVTDGYFQTLRIPLRQGRTFNQSDVRGAPDVAVVSDTAARRFWAGQDPVGKQIGFINADAPPRWFTIVGVVGSVRTGHLGTDVEPEVYTATLQTEADSMQATLLIRAEFASSSLATAVRAEIHNLDPSQPVASVRTMVEIVAESLAGPRFNVRLIGTLATISLLLALAGIFAVTAYSVAQKTREIGVRMALGGTGADILRLIVGRGMRPVLLGTVFGLAGAVILTRFIRGQLFGISAADPLTFVSVSVLLWSVSLLACWLPARRAAKVDPMVALRSE